MYNVAVSDERYGLSDNGRQDRWFSGPSRRVLSIKVSAPDTGRGRGPAGRSRPIVGLRQAPVHKRPRSVFTADAEEHISPVPGAHFAAAVGKSRLSIPHVSKELTCKYLTDLKLIGALEK
jgi:hypothetical protein